MHRSRLSTFVLDCKVPDLERAAEFWSRALGRSWRPEAEPDPNYKIIDSDGDEPILLVQKVEHESRIHLDIEADDIEAEVRRLEQLGAKRLKKIQTWVVMEAPTGQRFCVVRPQNKDFDQNSNRWD